MIRRFTSIFLCLLLMAPVALASSFSEIPDRQTFSLGYDRLQTAIYRERPVSWQARITPVAMDGLQDDAAEIVSAMMSALELSGILQCFKEGGKLEAEIRADGREIGSLGQMTMDGRTGLNLTGQWYSIAQGMEVEAATMLELDELGVSLLTMDYTGLRRGDVPFVSEIYRQGMALWGLASPYAEDSNRLSVPSGATSHGVTYEIDTQALRTILAAWADGLTSNGLSLGLQGSGLSIGVRDDVYEGFVERLRSYARTAELSKPIKLSTAFGEGDVLRTAKGSGTLKESSGRTGISYSYSCELSSTRITRKYKIDFEPTEMDSLVLSCTIRTSSNNKSSAGHDVSLTASGHFDGKPYRIKLDTDMANQYTVDDSGLLMETISGTLTASLKYDGQMVADVTVKRNGTTESSTGLTTAVAVDDLYDVLVKNDERMLFQGQIALSYSVAEGPQEVDNALETAVKLESIDLMSAQVLRDSLQEALAQAKQRLIQSLPASTLGSLMNAY